MNTSIRSRVVPGNLLTIETFLWDNPLIRVLLPTFGAPKIIIFTPYRTLISIFEQLIILLTL
jgi:hypothetical protein